MVRSMTRMILALTAVLLASAAARAEAACYAEYKAKRDNPLELHYDVERVDDPCTIASARTQLEARLTARGMTLLKVLSVSQG